jgi:hypothetical protein
MGGAGEVAPPASGARGWRLGPHRGLGGRGRPRREAGRAGESASESIRTYELRFVPGLLQSPAYARAVIWLRCHEPAVERRLALRMHRQRTLFERPAPRLWAVIDEAALRQQIGARAVMEE